MKYSPLPLQTFCKVAYFTSQKIQKSSAAHLIWAALYLLGGIHTKKVVVIMGSPRRNGNTEMLADALISGALEAGHQVEKLVISDVKVNGCTGCNACFRDDAHRCVQQDDMNVCYDLLAQADILVCATPIYFYGVSSQLKALIDRLHNPIRNTFSIKKLALLAVCADDQCPTVFDSVTSMYRSVLTYFSLEDGGMVTASGVRARGDILGFPALEEARQLGASL